MAIERGDDAQDRTRRPATEKGETASERPGNAKQDAKNYEKRTDGAKAVQVEDMSSANDEGAN